MTDKLGLAQARAAWWQRQALDRARSKAPLATVIGSSGWLRTLGGADVYLAARARRPGMTRAELDAVVVKGELRVVPAVRGCIYLVPARVVADLTALNAEAWTKDTVKSLAKIGRTLNDVESMKPAVLSALAADALTTDAIRKAIPGDTIPSFGEAGKKAGLSSPLPLALRLLELDGVVERTLDGGKLDSERYLWRKTRVELPPAAPTHDARLANVVDAFLGFAGPATIAHLAAWSGRAQRDLKAILAASDAVPVVVEDLGEAWVRRGELAAIKKAPPPSGLALLAFEDNYLINHGGLAAVSAAKHHAIKLDIWGGSKPETIGEADHVLSRTIVLDGLIAGLWEIDPRADGAVWTTFEPATKQLAAALDDLTANTARFLIDELGHAKAFTLDTMDDVQARADRIAKLRPGKKSTKK